MRDAASVEERDALKVPWRTRLQERNIVLLDFNHL
jgi:hypothetical protein